MRRFSLAAAGASYLAVFGTIGVLAALHGHRPVPPEVAIAKPAIVTPAIADPLDEPVHPTNDDAANYMASISPGYGGPVLAGLRARWCKSQDACKREDLR